jgi:hypothetical protein
LLGSVTRLTDDRHDSEEKLQRLGVATQSPGSLFEIGHIFADTALSRLAHEHGFGVGSRELPASV